jgi:hypothetical protein
MFGIDVITSYLLVVAIATLLMAVLIWQTHRTGRTVIVWLTSAALGVVLGSIGWFGAERTLGYHWVKAPPEGVVGPAASPPGMPSMGGMSKGGGPGMGGMGGGGMGMGGMSKGGGPGMGGMGGGGMGGMGMGPRPKRDLTTLVRKIDLLTGDIALTLTAEQTVAVNDCLKDLEKPAKMSDDDAKAKHDKLLALFNDTQKARFEAIGLPRPTGRPGGAGGPGGMPGMGGAGGGPGMPGMGGPGGMPGMGGAGAPKQDEDQNPFQQEAEGKSLKTLRERLAPKANAAKPTDKPAAPAAATPPGKDADKASTKKS